MKGSADGRLSKMIGTWPATVSFSAGPGAAVRDVGDEGARQVLVQLHLQVADAAGARARVRVLARVLLQLGDEALVVACAGKLGCTAITFGVAAMLMIGVKSVIGLYGIFGLIAGLAAVVETVAMPSV